MRFSSATIKINTRIRLIIYKKIIRALNKLFGSCDKLVKNNSIALQQPTTSPERALADVFLMPACLET